MSEGEIRRWWETRAFALFLVLASTIPLIWPDVPPLVDLPGHVGRYRVQLDIADSAVLRDYYTFEWALIGNLGVDLMVELLAPLLGLEAAVKLIVLTIPPLTAGGLLWVAREVHGRIPPTAMFALPFAYNFPLWFGFINFALAMALALLAFAFWLRLGRLGHVWLRAALFVPISAALWVIHAFGWGTLGVLAFSAELVRQYDGGRNLFVSGFRSAIHCLALTPPIALNLAWRSQAQGFTADWFNWERKLDWITMVLRDRWEWLDMTALVLVALLLLWALLSRRMTYSRNLAATALFLSIVFVLLPRIVFGSAYADLRLAPYAFAIALVAIRMTPRAGDRFTRALAIAGLAFFAVRTTASTASAWLYDRSYDRELAAIRHIPEGARLVSFIGRPCREHWSMSRLLHLPGLALARRHAFSNDQWTMPGAQLLQVRYLAGWPYVRDPTQVVTLRRCRGEAWRPVSRALVEFPRHAYDYVWLIQPPPFDSRLLAGLEPVWRDGTSGLYRVVDRRQPPGAR